MFHNTRQTIQNSMLCFTHPARKRVLEVKLYRSFFCSSTSLRLSVSAIDTGMSRWVWLVCNFHSSSLCSYFYTYFLINLRAIFPSKQPFNHKYRALRWRLWHFTRQWCCLLVEETVQIEVASILCSPLDDVSLHPSSLYITTTKTAMSKQWHFIWKDNNKCALLHIMLAVYNHCIVWWTDKVLLLFWKTMKVLVFQMFVSVSFQKQLWSTTLSIGLFRKYN